jgi:hypothetical protein
LHGLQHHRHFVEFVEFAAIRTDRSIVSGTRRGTEFVLRTARPVTPALTDVLRPLARRGATVRNNWEEGTILN